jgi:hypothetical protein
MADINRGGRPRIGKPARTIPGGEKIQHARTISTQVRLMPGPGQAVALTAAAKAKGYGDRAKLIREIIALGNKRDPAVVAKHREVGAAPTSAPSSERQISLVPEPGLIEDLDKQAAAAGISRNEFFRRHVAYWLRRYA